VDTSFACRSFQVEWLKLFAQSKQNSFLVVTTFGHQYIDPLVQRVYVGYYSASKAVGPLDLQLHLVQRHGDLSPRLRYSPMVKIFMRNKNDSCLKNSK
jgi:hypothetical protein